jgi:phosphoserine phosphatase
VLIARLIADTAALTQAEDLVHRLKQHGISASVSGWGGANGIQLAAEGTDAASLAKALDGWFAPSDLLIADQEPKIPAVFISDMDSTMIMAECIDELADFAGIKPQIAAITERLISRLPYVSGCGCCAICQKALSPNAWPAELR